MKELLKRQMEFEYWANSELLIKLKEASPLNERALSLYSHIMSVNAIWLNRIKGETVIVNLFQKRKLEECEVMLQANYKNWNTFFVHQKKKLCKEKFNSISRLTMQQE